MKKIYQAPQVEATEINTSYAILSVSGEANNEVGDGRWHSEEMEQPANGGWNSTFWADSEK